MTAPDTERALVLVVSVDAERGAALRTAIDSLGFRTCCVGDAAAATEVAVAERPDLCVVVAAGRDGVAGGDRDAAEGLDACRRLKRDPRTARLPVVAIAGEDTSSHTAAADAGADDVLSVNHYATQLSARVKALVRLKTAMDALDESSRRLRELEKVRDDLMKMIVHDLKTPLTSVLATLEMLADGDLGELNFDQGRAIADMGERGKELLSLIDDLLQVWRIESTTVPLELADISPATFLDELLTEWHYRFHQAEAQVRLDVAPDARTIRGDRALLRRVFGNLIQNALTHTPAPVQLRISARDDRRGVLFTVADSGPGIPAAYQEVIFRKFHRLPRPNEARVRGSGLGLAFCRLAVEAHGGRIWVQSEEGAGSAFHVVLPLNPAAAVMRRVWNI
jgi:signal transduction histidine kinase